ncbi:MAG: amino acid adenylation domain-containing protein, partial [Lutisporaceae bacterium]
KANSLLAFENQDYQFEELIDKLNVTRDLSRNPLFDVMFSMQNVDNKEISIGELDIKPYNTENKISKFDMTLTALESEDNIDISLNYCTSLYSKKTIGKLIEYYTNILEGISNNINQNISEIDMLTKEEKHQILLQFNNTKAEYPKHETIHELFEEQAQSNPDSIAVVYEDNKLTYSSLNEKSNQIARVLRSKGVKADSIVAIMVERSAEMIIGIMGIIKAGGAYLPIDPEYPNDRIAYMLQDSKATILLTQTHLANKGDFGIELIDLKDNSIYMGDNSNLDNINTTNNLVYTIYTSGSTGKPKGVMVEHKNLVNLVYGLKERIYKENKNLKVAMVSPYVFDASVKQIFPALLLGHTLCIIPEDTRLDANKLYYYYTNNSIDVADGTPTHLKMLTTLEKQAVDIGIKQFVIGGEALSTELVDEYYSKYNKNCIINNVYGPTECCDVTTVFSVTSNMKIKSPIVPIGYPISNAKVYIVDRYNKAVPIGVLGELCISGAGVTRGYLNRAELTAEKFIDNPYDMTQKMYKTGDLVRWSQDGNIEFLGRIDHQVKIRGYRIELGEVEARILSCEGIKEATVIAREAEGNKYICAYITGNREFTVSELREYLLKELPEYMIPTYFIQLDKLPLTANGKIDRKALPEPDGSITTGTEYVAPSNETEEKLVSIWQEVLGIQKVGINDNFFELGGHSLKAINIAAKINRELNVSVPLAEMFKTPTIKGLASYVKGTKQSIYSRIEPVEEKDYYPLSSAQKRIYALQQFEENNISYNMPMVMTLEGELDKTRLEETFNKLIQRHEALRTSFEVIEGEPVQIVHRAAGFEIEYAEADKEKASEIAVEFVKAFDLSKAPLIRVTLAKIKDKEHILMIDKHHIISDGISTGILTKEFMELYDGKELTELRIQYKDFAVWQNEMFKSGEIKKQEEYWLKAFEGEVPVLNMPTDYQRPSIQSFEGDNISIELSEELTGKLKQIAKETGSTMYMVLLSAYNVLLSKYSGQADIIIGSPIAGRPHADLQSIMGMFVNTLAMRNYPESSKTFKEFLEEVKANSLQAFENQDYQFEELIDKLNIKRDLSRNPLFDVMFSMQNLDAGEMQIEGLTFKPYEIDNNIAKFDMTITAVELNKTIMLSLNYCTKLFNKQTIENMSKHLTNILSSISSNTNLMLSEVEMLSEEEKHQVLIDFNNTEADYPREKTINQLFEEQVDKTPDNIAVEYENTKLTYNELNAKANDLAIILQNKEVEADSIVGIMIDRSLDMIIGIMATLKAGGAYLPIDPEYPKDRIEYMLSDSNTKILLTQSHLAKDMEFEGETIIIEDIAYSAEGSSVTKINKATDLAYIIYTSGSTGKPKGVMIEHKSVVNLAYSQINQFKVNEKDRILQFSTICFDASIEQIFIALLSGAALILVNKDTILDIQAFEEYIIKHEVTHIHAVPTFLSNINYRKEYKVKRVVAGGDICPINLAKYWNEHCDFYNEYGPTETTVTSIMLLAKNITEETNNLSIGKPINNLQIYILDKNKNLQPTGIPGELYIAGDCLARGYLNREELTAERFIENPFALVHGEKMYKTGDLASWLPDGNIEFLGRLDNQVKVRGFRIELGEIETRILSYEGIEEAIVIAREEEGGNSYLCAYITGIREFTISELREHLAEELPEYMIPAYILQLDKLPLTTNGKIDRKALPEPDGSINTGVEYEAPSNEIQEKLAEIWSEVLGIEKVGINDNFFELGGHSLKAINIIAKINKELNVSVPLREMFKTPTIKGLASYVEGTKQSIYSRIEPVEEHEHYPLSSAQKRIYTLQQFEENNISYNMPMVMSLEGELDKIKLEETFDKLIKRHEALRTSFEIIDGEAVQVVHKEVSFKIEYTEADKEKAREIAAEFVKAFDLSKAPLLRVALTKIKDKEHILMIDMHHIISDGVSMGILTKEFMELYDGKELTELRIQYKDFAAWQNELFKSGEIKKEEEYWLKAFEGEVPVLNMPTDYQRPSIQSFEGDNIGFELDEELTGKLKQIAKETGSTMYMALLSVCNVLLSKYSGQEDIVIGSPIAGRPHADLQNIMGMFVNTLAMR